MAIKKAIFYRLNTLYIHKRYLTIREAKMTTENQTKFTVITNNELTNKAADSSQTNPIAGNYANPYLQKLMQFSADQKRKRFTVEDLLR